jgi:hypothetical protein
MESSLNAWTFKNKNREHMSRWEQIQPDVRFTCHACESWESAFSRESSTIAEKKAAEDRLKKETVNSEATVFDNQREMTIGRNGRKHRSRKTAG